MIQKLREYSFFFQFIHKMSLIFHNKIENIKTACINADFIIFYANSEYRRDSSIIPMNEVSL